MGKTQAQPHIQEYLTRAVKAQMESTSPIVYPHDSKNAVRRRSRTPPAQPGLKTQEAELVARPPASFSGLCPRYFTFTFTVTIFEAAA